MPDCVLEWHVLFAVIAGLFTTVGHFAYFSAVNRGSVEVAQLFANLKPIVQLTEEAIFMSIFPNFFALVGVAIAVIGSTLVILGKPNSKKKDSMESSDN